MMMSDIQKSRVYADVRGRGRRVMDIGSHCRPLGSRQAYTGVIYTHVDDPDQYPHRAFLLDFAKESAQMVVGL